MESVIAERPAVRCIAWLDAWIVPQMKSSEAACIS